MKKTKQVLIISALICVAITIGMLICGLLFKLKFWRMPWSKIIAISTTLAIGISFALSALSYYTRNRVISIVSLCMTSLSVLLFVIFYLRGFKTGEIYFKIIGIVAIVTVIMNVVVYSGEKLKKNLIALQIISSVLICFVGLVLILAILGVNLFKNDWFLKLFIVIILIEIGMLFAIGILAKKSVQIEDKKDNDSVEKVIKGNFVKLTVDEYNKLILKIKQQEDAIKELQDKLNKN